MRRNLEGVALWANRFPWSIIAYGYFHVAMIAYGYYSGGMRTGSSAYTVPALSELRLIEAHPTRVLM